jgi:hypothetical protein
MRDENDDRFLEEFAEMPERLERGRDGMDLSRLDPNTALVYTGLGGVGERLRYIVIVAAQTPPLVEVALPALRARWAAVAQSHNSAVESLELAPRYLLVQLLIPMDVAPHDVIIEALERCAEVSVALHPEYYITNVAQPTAAEIEAFLEDLGVGKA